MFIPPILYEKFPDIDSFSNERILEEFNKINLETKISFTVKRNKKSYYQKRKKKSKVINNNIIKYKKELKNILIQREIKKSKYNYEFKKKAIKIREKYKKCQQCSSDNFLMVHHKDKNTFNNSDDNLILLCFNCHKKHHKHLTIPGFMKK